MYKNITELAIWYNHLHNEAYRLVFYLQKSRPQLHNCKSQSQIPEPSLYSVGVKLADGGRRGTSGVQRVAVESTAASVCGSGIGRDRRPCGSSSQRSIQVAAGGIGGASMAASAARAATAAKHRLKWRPAGIGGASMAATAAVTGRRAADGESKNEGRGETLGIDANAIETERTP